MKYKLGDKVLFKETPLCSKVQFGEIEKIYIEKSIFKENETTISYFIKIDKQISLCKVSEQSIICIANNVTTHKVIRGIEAESKVGNILKSISFNIEVQSLEFKGNSTTLKYKKERNPQIFKVTSECHPHDNFNFDKGVEACLLKCIIEQAENRLKKL